MTNQKSLKKIEVSNELKDIPEPVPEPQPVPNATPDPTPDYFTYAILGITVIGLGILLYPKPEPKIQYIEREPIAEPEKTVPPEPVKQDLKFGKKKINLVLK